MTTLELGARPANPTRAPSRLTRSATRAVDVARLHLRRVLIALEPWYDWGRIYVERMEGSTVGEDGYGRAGGEGEVRYLQLQWFGLHLGFQIGRTPKREGRAMNSPLTRRAAMTALSAGTIAAAIVPATASTIERTNMSGVSPELATLIASHTAAAITIDRFYDDVFNPACERQHERIRAIPHVVRQITPFNGDPREYIEWSTERRLDVACAAGLVKLSRRADTLAREPGALQRRREARSFWAASIRRDRAVKRAMNDPALDAARAEEDRLWAPQSRRETAIEQFPVRTLADLQAKLAFMGRREADLRDDLLPLFAADVARLIGEEA